MFVLGELENTANYLMNAAFSGSTLKTYSSTHNKYLDFCKQHTFSPLPATDNILSLFVASLHREGFKGSSIRVYLSGIRNLHILNNFPTPVYFPRLQLNIKGSIKVSSPPSRKLPITFPLLEKLCKKNRFYRRLVNAHMCDVHCFLWLFTVRRIMYHR